jgi:hypothetical protein
MKNILFTLILTISFLLCRSQQQNEFVPNYDESKIPSFEVPDPLTTFKGKKIRNVKQWEKVRRPELLDFFTDQVYGKVPGELKISKWEVVEQSDNALNGKATGNK